MTPEIELSEKRLSRRLMAAIERGCPRRVQSLLGCGAKANRFCPAVHRWDNRYAEVVGIAFPLAELFLSYQPSRRPEIAALLISAGADVSVCLYWLVATEESPVFQIQSGLQLCEIIRTSRWQPVYRRTIQTWLNAVSLKLNRYPEPPPGSDRSYVISVHRELARLSIDYGVAHAPEPWVTAELL